MKSPEKFPRFSSCRGVAFEIKPHSDPFAVPTPLVVDGRCGSNRFWFPWNQDGSFRAYPSDSLGRSMSRISSHFCDLDIDENDFEDDLKDLEQGAVHEEKEQKLVPVSFTSKREQPATVARQLESRLSIILLDQGPFTVYKRLFMRGLLASRLLACGEGLGTVVGASRTQDCYTSLLQSLGGIHSGCGVSSVAWLVYALVLTLEDRENTSPEIISVAFTILALLCLSSLAAFPLVRHLHHNVFERTHRFAGWIALALLWAFVLLTISYDPKSKSYSNQLGSRLMKQQEFWSTLAITALIIIPWVTVRRVPVKVSAPSGHASIIKFEGGVKRVYWEGLVDPLYPSGMPSASFLMVHFAGLPYLINMYDKVMMVATGSGICVFLSFLLQPCSADVCLVWVAKGIEHNFGREIKEIVNRYPKDKVIVHDTAVSGRPDIAQLSVDTAKNWGAQVVIVTSNPQGSRDVVNACKDAGIPAFGPIWDS
ncbi:hypothetical protein CK203_113522 [Vitis vinifera]|uniref:Adenylate-forming reductase 03009 n=1 Tax=Vitis vinifera TaxID=29760 RepID=A0A438CRF5_VITVI|nr:hypothetical protein CK203_113522 [Vitis vinifera]